MLHRDVIFTFDWDVSEKGKAHVHFHSPGFDSTSRTNQRKMSLAHSYNNCGKISKTEQHAFVIWLAAYLSEDSWFFLLSLSVCQNVFLSLSNLLIHSLFSLWLSFCLSPRVRLSKSLSLSSKSLSPSRTCLCHTDSLYVCISYCLIVYLPISTRLY